MMHGTSLQRLNLLLPQARMVLGCPLSLPWCARAWKFRVWVEGNEVGSPFHQKNALLCCLRVLAPQALARRQPSDFWRLQALSRRWTGAGPCLLAPPGAGKALRRRWADLFWENGHCAFIHRWI